MASQLRPYFEAGRPIWLLTITLPSVVIHLSDPAPTGAPYEVTDAGGRVRRFYPGLLVGGFTPSHDLIGGAPSVPLAFTIPAVYGVAYPSALGWTSAKAELSQWFEGLPWEDRRVILSDALSDVKTGGAGEPVEATLTALTEDKGVLLDPEAVVTFLTWPDVGDEPETTGSSPAFDATQRYRAYQNAGKPYGEIIGHPRWVRALVVANETLAEHSTSTELEPVTALICDGRLGSNSNRRVRYYATARDHDLWEVTIAGGISTGADANGRVVTLLAAGVNATDSGSKLFVPSSIAASPEAYIANLRYVGTWIRPGDNIKRDGDGAEFYRVIDTLESGDAASSSYFGLAKLSAEYGGLTSPTDDDTADGVQWVPLVRDGGSIFVDFTSAGGHASPSDQNTALSSLREVAATYLSRSSGIRVDFEALDRARWLDRFTVDAHLTDPGASPLGWLMGEVFAALPVVGAWLGGGLTFVDVDPTATAFVADLDVGRDGRDGDRLSMVTTQDPTVVIDAVTVRYGFDESTGKFEGYIYTASRRYAPRAAISGAFVVNDRAMASQEAFGRRHLEIELPWTNDETTARAVANGVLNLRHKPRWRLGYKLRPAFGWLDVGDVVRMTDSDLGRSNVLARIVVMTHDRTGPVVVLEEMG